LLNYGASNADARRPRGLYTGRLLGEVKPGNLPVQPSTKIELFVNLKTVRALRLMVPQSLLPRAEEVIQ